MAGGGAGATVPSRGVARRDAERTQQPGKIAARRLLAAARGAVGSNPRPAALSLPRPPPIANATPDANRKREE